MKKTDKEIYKQFREIITKPKVTRPELRTFNNFPKDVICPVCNTNENDKCVLIEIDGTSNGSIAEGQPVHLGCAVVNHYNPDIKLLYRRII